MLKPVVIIVCMGLIIYCIRRLMAPARPDLKHSLRILGLLIAATGGLLAITGKLHILGVLLAGLIPVFRTLAPWVLRALPGLLRHWHRRQQPNQTSSTHQRNPHNTTATAMSTAEAYEILDLKPGASKEEIIQRHKQLMQKNHPDRGGSDYLASKINLAKKVLLATLE